MTSQTQGPFLGSSQSSCDFASPHLDDVKSPLLWRRRLREDMRYELLHLPVSRVELQGRLAFLARLLRAIQGKINPRQAEVTRKAVLELQCGLEFSHSLLVLVFRFQDLRQVQVRLAVAGGQRGRLRQFTFRLGQAPLADEILPARYMDSRVLVSRHTRE